MLIQYEASAAKGRSVGSGKGPRGFPGSNSFGLIERMVAPGIATVAAIGRDGGDVDTCINGTATRENPQ
jgi:hypothetical protein